MPLASSRSASQKRAASVAAEKKEEKRRQRLSLPSTCDSSTVVTESKARRRQSLRRQSSCKENSDPHQHSNTPPKKLGVTPYWKVAEGRGGETSPRLTRSASKDKRSKKNHHPPRPGAGVLTFSPPNQMENAKREERERMEKQAARLRRVQEARDNGQLLVFSPTHRDSQELNDSSIDNSISGKDFEVSSEASVNQSSLTESHHLPPPSNGTDPDLFKEMMQKIDAKLSTVGAADKELFGFKINVLNEKIVQVETEKTALEGKLKEVTSKLVEEKESYLVDRTRLESQIESTSREADIKVSMLKDARDKIQSQFEALQSEKMELLGRVKELEARIITTQAQLDDSKNHLAALQDDNRAEVAGLESKWKEMKTLNEDLSRKAEALELEQRESQSKISDYESCIRSLEQNLQESMRELSKYKEMVASKSSAESQLVSQVDKLRQKVQKLENKVSELSSVNEEQRSSFQQLNEQSGVELEKLQKDKAEKDAKIGELFKQVGELEQIVEKEREKASSGIKSIENCLQEKEKHIGDLNRSLQNALNQVKSVNASRADLEVQVQKELDDMKAQVEQYEQYLQQEKKQKVEALDKVSLLERRLNENESDMQKRIRTIEKERDEALVSMQCFNDREHELYRRLQESDRIRKSLHSRVMQLMGNIRVFVRVRPPLPDEIDAEKARLEKEASDGKKRKRVDDYTLFRFPGVYDQQCKRPASNSSSDDASKNIIELTEPYKDRGGLSERQKKYRYAFDGVFSPDHGQEDIWEATEPLIQCAIDGFNVTLFAYGQTGAGKTYTMLGGQGQEEGIIGRSVKMLFSKKDEIESLSKGGTSVKISVELLEIYNEQVRDLLAPNSGPQGREVPLKVTSKEVVGNVKVDTSTQEEVMKILHLAQKRRCVKATSSNSESSRSHMLFTIHYMSTSKDGIATEGKLNICDLAGSERLSKSGAHNVGGDLLKETQNINKSLSTLSNVIEKLQAGSDVIPYRESKLTFLLQNSLGGNSKTLAIVCCNPLASHFSESSNSLKFAEKVNKVDLKQTKANVTY